MGFRLAKRSVGAAYMRPVCREPGGSHICDPYKNRSYPVARPSDASSGYTFMRAFSGSNIAERGATLTGKRSFMYCTCSLLPAAACSTGR